MATILDFQNGHHENLVLSKTPVLIDIESQFWCLHLYVFRGKVSSETAYKTSVSFLHHTRKYIERTVRIRNDNTLCTCVSDARALNE